MIRAKEFKRKYRLWELKIIEYCDWYEDLTDGVTHILFEEDKIIVCGDDGEGEPEFYDAEVFRSCPEDLDKVAAAYRSRNQE